MYLNKSEFPFSTIFGGNWSVILENQWLKETKLTNNGRLTDDKCRDRTYAHEIYQ